MLTYVALYSGFDLADMVADVTKRRFITVGVAAWLLLVPLAATSTNWAIRKMGGKNWNRLHKLVYVAAVCGIVHYWWQVKTGVHHASRHHADPRAALHRAPGAGLEPEAQSTGSSRRLRANSSYAHRSQSKCKTACATG